MWLRLIADKIRSRRRRPRGRGSSALGSTQRPLTRPRGLQPAPPFVREKGGRWRRPWPPRGRGRGRPRPRIQLTGSGLGRWPLGQETRPVRGRKGAQPDPLTCSPRTSALPLTPLQPRYPATQGNPARRALGPRGAPPAPAATPALERPPRRSRGLTRQGEHRVVHFAAHHAGALRDAVHPQPLVHGLGGDDIVASVRAHLPLRDGGACHQAHPAQQSHGKAQQLQARIGHFRPQNRRGAPGGRVFKLPKEAKKKLVDCLQIWSPE